MIDRGLHLLPRDLAKISAFRKKLTKEAVGVFIDASLPGGIGMGKVGGRLQRPRNRFMFHKL